MKATDIRVETVEVTFDDERLSVPPCTSARA